MSSNRLKQGSPKFQIIFHGGNSRRSGPSFSENMLAGSHSDRRSARINWHPVALYLLDVQLISVRRMSPWESEGRHYHISSVTKSCFFHLRRIRQIKVASMNCVSKLSFNWHHRRCWRSASNPAQLARHECRFRHRRPRHPPASMADVVRCTGAGISVTHLLSDRKDSGCVLRWPDVPTMPTIVVCRRVRSSDLSFLFFIRQMSSELPWDVEFESTYMPTTPRSTSVALHRIVNPLSHVCWPTYRKSNPGWAQLGWNWMPWKQNSSGLVLNGRSPKSREKPWWSVGNQSRRWWRYGISVSSSTGSWQWRLTWAILYVAACINSANFAASSGRWPSKAGAHLPQHLLLVVSTTATLSYMVLRKKKFSDLELFWTLLRDSSLIRESSATSPLSSVMYPLHWLPVQHQISYKIAILTRNCIHGIGPAYFGNICVLVTAAPGRTNLRSATRGDLVIPRTRTKLGERSFRISAPTVWNSLPDSLKHLATSREHFRKELKTYLFRRTYAPASENYWRVNLLTSNGWKSKDRLRIAKPGSIPEKWYWECDQDLLTTHRSKLLWVLTIAYLRLIKYSDFTIMLWNWFTINITWIYLNHR